MDIQYSPSVTQWLSQLPVDSDFQGTETDAFLPDHLHEQVRCDLPAPTPAADADSMLSSLFAESGATYPRQLEQRFPHVIRRMETLWGTDEMYRFLDSLTPDETSRCQGFPPELQGEIRSLQSAYRARYPQPVTAIGDVPAVAEGAAPALEPVVESEPIDDWDVWRHERRLRNWEERSVY